MIHLGLQLLRLDRVFPGERLCLTNLPIQFLVLDHQIRPFFLEQGDLQCLEINDTTDKLTIAAEECDIKLGTTAVTCDILYGAGPRNAAMKC